jgi:DNA-directed RNA polymerase subunit E'/Rpb7
MDNNDVDSNVWIFLIETGKKIQQQEKIKAHIEQTNPKTIGSSLTDNSY